MVTKLDASSSLLILSLACLTACPKDDPPKSEGETGETGPGDGDGDGEVEHGMPCPDPERSFPPSVEMCPPERQIAQVPGDCPDPDPGSGWTLQPLFSGAAVPEPMTHYCRYLWTDPGAPNLTALPMTVQGQTTPDCRVFPQSPLAPSLTGPFANAFAEGVQLVPEGAPTLGLGAPVDIAVIDTAPAATGEGKADHGPTIAAIIATVAAGCAPALDKTECRRQVFTYLGLPQNADEGPDYTAGGFYGYQTDLAEGIVAALEGWTNHDHKLIINLSVGWEPSLGDLDIDGTAPTAALASVRDAIAFGHCQGALTIAASGNQPDGSCVDQATGPGGWERLPGWDVAQCTAFGVDVDLIDIDASQAYHPFLYAATPIDWDLENLGDFRPGSNARVTTVGFAGLVNLAGTVHGPLTGSSVATASLSGIAGFLWSYYPTLTPDQVMQAIYDGGIVRMIDNAPVNASVFFGQTAPEQRMVTACSTIEWACANLVGAPSQTQCDQVTTNCETAYGNGSIDVDAATWFTSFTSAFDQLPDTDKGAENAPDWKVYECMDCGLPTVSKLPADESIPAEAMGDPWVLPQPETPPCPMCMIDDDEIYLSIDDDYANMALDNVIIELYDDVGGAEFINYGSLPLSPITVHVVTDADVQIVDRSGLPPVKARVTMVFTNTGLTGPMTITVGNEIPIR